LILRGILKIELTPAALFSMAPRTVLCAGLEECSMIRHDALPFCFELQRLT